MAENNIQNNKPETLEKQNTHSADSNDPAHRVVTRSVYYPVDKSAPQTEPKEMIRVSVSEAARLFGVTSQTIRRALSNQEITYVVVAGRYKINFESLVKWSQQKTTVRNKLAKKGIGQFVKSWKIKNPLYSPNPKSVKTKKQRP